MLSLKLGVSSLALNKGVRTRPWTPLDLGAELVSWTDFSAASTITLNTSTIAAITNRQIGTRYNFAQATGARQPSKTAATQNGLDCATWSGQSIYMTEPRNKGVNRGAMFAALKPTTGAGYIIANTQSSGGLSWDLGGTGGRARLLRQGVGAIASSTTPVPVGSWSIIAAILTDSSWSFRLNGAADGSGTPAVLPSVTGVMQIGAGNPTSSSCFLGDFGELIDTTQALSGADIARIEGYLAWKWGLVALLPSDHAYKIAAPVYTYLAKPYSAGYVNFTGDNLPHWLAARAAGSAKIVCYGDSTTAGQAASVAESWPSIVAAALASSGLEVNRNFWSWKKGAVTDDRSSRTGTWANGASNTLGGPCASTTGAGATLSYTPVGNVDRIEVRYPVDTELTGGFSVAIDGDAQTAISNNGTQAIGVTTYSMALGPHSIVLTATGAEANQLASIRAWDSSASEVQVINAGWPGASSPELTGVATEFDSLAALIALAPDLVIVEAGIINNWNGGQMNTVENVSTIIQALQTAGIDVMLQSSIPSDPAHYASLTTQAQYVGDMLYAAIAYNVPFIDIWGGLCGGDYANVSANSWGSGDYIHPSADGYAAMGAFIAPALAQGFVSVKQ